MYGSAVRAKKTTEEYGFGKTGQIGQDKAMPPKVTTTSGTGRRLLPEIFLAQNG
jgi:hypothetical protein